MVRISAMHEVSLKGKSWCVFGSFSAMSYNIPAKTIILAVTRKSQNGVCLGGNYSSSIQVYTKIMENENRNVIASNRV